jgi:hypothetical protein
MFKKNGTLFIFAVSMLITANLASAAVTITQSKSVTGKPNFTSESNGYSPLQFLKFDNSLGTLLEVIFTTKVVSNGGVLRLDYDGVDPVSGTVKFGTEVNTSIGRYNIARVQAFQVYENIAFEADDGDINGKYKGRDSREFINDIPVIKKDGPYSYEGRLDSFKTDNINETFDLDYTTRSEYTMNFEGTFKAERLPLDSATIYADVQYVYSAIEVPEPSTIPLIGMALMGLYLRKRK